LSQPITDTLLPISEIEFRSQIVSSRLNTYMIWPLLSFLIKISLSICDK